MVSYKGKKSIVTRVVGDTGKMETRIMDEPDCLTVSLISRTGARFATIAETMVVTRGEMSTNGEESIHISQVSECCITLRFISNRVQNYWFKTYKTYHESAKFLQEYGFPTFDFVLESSASTLLN